MACYLCVWKINGVFRWAVQRDEAARSALGEEINRRWSVANTQRIREDDRIYLKVSGKQKGIKAERGLIASGFAVQPPSGMRAVAPGSVVFQDYPYKRDGTENLDLTKPRGNFVQIRFDVILPPENALPISRLEGIGKLGTMFWNVPRSGTQIQPRRTQSFRGNLTEELNLVWDQHLEKLQFPIGEDEEERTVSIAFGQEGRRRLILHRKRERWPGLAKRKREEVLQRGENLECQVCRFDFSDRYGDYGYGFMEVHHRDPLANADPDEGRIVTTADVDLVCANCHRIIHWKSLLTLEELRSHMRF